MIVCSRVVTEVTLPEIEEFSIVLVLLETQTKDDLA